MTGKELYNLIAGHYEDFKKKTDEYKEYMRLYKKFKDFLNN